MTDEQTKEELTPPIVDNKRFVGETIDHQFCGVIEFYDDEKNLIAEQTFDKGVLHGESRKYDRFHKLTEKLTYHEGHLQGPAEFYKNDTPTMKANFSEGKQDGETILYDEAGMVQSRIQFAHGLRQGTLISYDPLGRVQQIQNYVQDLLEGPMTTYFPSGSLMEAGEYVQGKKQGEFISYYENGVVQQILVFDRGRQLYPPQLFDINGYPRLSGIAS
jgi:antitoxin component YwqK of YwqJK toxin-antitoxin module